MPITDPEAIRFVNEQIRPLAEKFRDLKVEVDAAATTWFAGVNAKFTNDPTNMVEDGREAEGVSRLSGEDIFKMIAELGAFRTRLNGAGVEDIISKPTVRPLRTQG